MRWRAVHRWSLLDDRGTLLGLPTDNANSAADMIKLAMIAISTEMKSLAWPARMLLQIHDELVFEVREDYVGRFANIVREKMITVLPLNVPLKVDIKHGPNWASCELL